MIKSSPQINLKQFIAMVERSCRINFKDFPSVDAAFMHVTTPQNTLLSRNYKYPNLYHIQGIDGKEYLIMYCESNIENTDIMQIEVGLEPDDTEESVCKQLIANEARLWWGLEAFGYYNMFGYIPLACKDDTEVAIWVEQVWEDGHRNMPDNDYLKGDDGDNIIFDTYAQAEQHLSILMEKGYTLAPHEVSRPVYTITE